MKLGKLLAASLMTASLALTAQADWQQGPGGDHVGWGSGTPGGPGRGPGGPGGFPPGPQPGPAPGPGFGGGGDRHGGGPGFGGPGHGGPGWGGHDDHGGWGRGPGFGGPGFGHGGPGFGPRGPMPGWFRGGRPGWGWGRPGWGPRFPVPPPPPPPMPSPSSGLCQGNFSGQFEYGRNVMISLNGNGYYASAAVMMDNPGEQFNAQGSCQDVEGGAQLSLTLNNGAMLTGQIYLASDGVVYIDGSQSSDGQRFILQRQ